MKLLSFVFFVKVIVVLVGALVLGFGGLLAFLSVTEYRPGTVERADAEGAGTRVPVVGVPMTVVSWNIGYGSLDAGMDFFMDGGKATRPPTDANVKENMRGVRDFIGRTDADIVLLQEVDIHSYRSYYMDQAAFLAETWDGATAFAPNFRTAFVPIPLPHPLGRVDSGLFTLSAFAARESLRVSLPSPFKWPVRLANLKRCILVERLPVADSDKELILVNLHLEAYSSAEGRDAQMRVLLDFLKAEYAKGNYCIAGGDFNQNFPRVDENMFRLKDVRHFTPGVLSQDTLPEGWRFAADTEVPSSRLLNEPYSGDWETTQLYAIDGFALSPNVEVLSVQTANHEFRYSDHNPVVLKAVLKAEFP
ncbi:MAG: endonuclease/exonuclease/phosphatase family protein [Treponema sp.]|jgi:endonuclease/exonuclease/phosphatase family metal-dependent hydrolase|nr:endonuclease/exonuclease/phosphatase family protein [Treponema sp.]